MEYKREDRLPCIANLTHRMNGTSKRENIATLTFQFNIPYREL